MEEEENIEQQTANPPKRVDEICLAIQSELDNSRDVLRTGEMDLDPEGNDTVRVMEVVDRGLIGRRYDSMWRFGSSNLDKRLLQFIAQVFISIGTLVFCGYQLIKNPSCDDQTQYLALGTMVIGVFLPEPQFR